MKAMYNDMISTILMLVVLLQLSRCTQDYDFITTEIKLEMNGLKEEADEIYVEVKSLSELYRKSIPVVNSFIPANIPTTKDRMYKWFSERGAKSARKCLASHKNLEMIRNHSSESVHQCYSRVDRIVNVLIDKAASLRAMVEKQVKSCFDLALPCEVIESKSDCLTQAWEQAKQKREALITSLQRFNIFKRLREYEADVNCKLCQSIADSYRRAEKKEETTLEKCINEEEKMEKELPLPDHKQ